MPDFIEYGENLKTSTDLKGMYRARIESNLDPEGLGRVKVRIPMLHGISGEDGIADEDLPWATLGSMSAGFNYGTFMVPERGEYVHILFEDENKEKPIVIHSLYGKGSTEAKFYGVPEGEGGRGEWFGEEGGNEVPEEGRGKLDPAVKILYKSPKGAIIYVDETNDEEKVLIKDKFGQLMRFSGGEDICIEILGEEGSPEIHIDSTEGYLRVKTEGGEIHLDKDGNVSIKANETVKIESKRVNVASERVNVESREVVINSSGGINISAGSTVNVNSSSDIELNAPYVGINGDTNIRERW